ncbi:peptidoglycan-binding protein [Haladaptatus sp. DYSN1]|uniref:peptidoglycan-binding domain-containing protein n=1 Tax=unclassified Haladaptatus TaxID=2622732 RepID=UPI0024076D23|nr:peptidoglycan-binding domain-containing protein [Haladaptatus sp. DYSN1]
MATYGVQHHLKYGQGYSIAVDGYYGPETKGAVEDFQSNAGIRVDGVIGHDTWQALMAL